MTSPTLLHTECSWLIKRDTFINRLLFSMVFFCITRYGFDHISPKVQDDEVGTKKTRKLDLIKKKKKFFSYFLIEKEKFYMVDFLFGHNYTKTYQEV